MDHFKGLNEQERYQNDLLNEIRKQTALLERLSEKIEQLLQPKNEVETVTARPRKRAKRSV